MIRLPAMRERLQDSPAALSVLDAMEEEHGFIDLLLAAGDHAIAGQETSGQWLGDAVGELTTKLTCY